MNEMLSDGSDHLIEASNVMFSYDSGSIILDGVGLKLRRGEVMGILGPNGSGKTTFMKCLNRILTPKQGEILLMGNDIQAVQRREVARVIGFVPQTGGSSGEMSAPMVYDVVMMGRRPHMSWRQTENDDEIVWDVMKQLDVAHLASRCIDELSSGQLQRVLIARAIAQDASVILLDEPTSNLDVKYQMEVMGLIRGIVEEKNVSACAIVHDLDLAMKYCDHVVLLHEGRIVSSGPPVQALTPEAIREVYGVDAYVQDICGRYRVLLS